MIEHYLNIRHSLRNLTDEDFENVLTQLAIELESVSYIPQYSTEKLVKDWKDLQAWNTNLSLIHI